MNAAQIHLLVNHLPVIIPMIGAPILGIGLWLGSSDLRKMGLWLLILSALIAIPTYLSGEPAESFIKNYPGVARFGIHQHLEAAKISLIGIEVAGFASLVVLLYTRLGKTLPRFIWGIVLLLSATSTVLMLRTSHLGGQIRHEEIQTEEFLQAS